MKEKTEICRICFKNFVSHSYVNFFNKTTYICEQCYKDFHPIFKKFTVNKIKCLAVYNYDDFIKEKLFTLKGSYDIELAVIFLSLFSLILKFLYLGFYLVPVPSYIDDNLKRGFNHVEEIFKELHLPFLHVIQKTNPIKQSDQKLQDREKIIERLKIVDEDKIRNKNILLVDDVFTTGSTIKACIELLSEHKPKKIKVLVMCKVLKNEEFSSN